MCRSPSIEALSYFGTEIEPRLHGDERTTLVWSMLMYYYLDWFQCFIVAIPLAYFCLEKLTRHKLMLDQMAAFELRCASCSLNSDREVIEQQIIDLFDEAFEPPVSVFFETIHEDGGSNHAGENKETLAPEEETLYPLVSRETMQVIRHVTSYPTPDEVMEQFNGYIRGSLREKVLGLLGREVDVSLKLCLVSCMPGFLLSLTFFLGCNGHQDCEASASALGYPSLPQYMLINALILGSGLSLQTLSACLSLQFQEQIVACPRGPLLANALIPLCCIPRMRRLQIGGTPTALHGMPWPGETLFFCSLVEAEAFVRFGC